MKQEASNILVVEDDPLFTRLLSAILSSKGWTVLACSSAEEALQIMASQDFRLLITDLRMDGLGGVGLIRSLMQSGSFPLDRILVITGDPQNSEESVWVEDQNIQILRKPFSVKALLETVQSLAHTNS